MRLRSSVLWLVALAGCDPEVDPLLICHNANCAGTGQYEDDTMEGLKESLALTTDGRPPFDGVEVDTYLYFDGTTSTCLFAHDDLSPELAAPPRDAAELLATHLQGDVVSWNGERFYLKIELKPTVAGSNEFHTGQQLQQHAECAMDLARVAVANTQHPITIIFDGTSECLDNELQYRITLPEWADLATNPLLEILYSGPLVPTRQCVPAEIDIHTFNVRSWRDSAYNYIRPLMVWLDGRSENTETLKILRHLRPEYIATSNAPFVRGWVEGYR